MSAEEVLTSKQTAIGTAYSKLILIGEHAVVHGQPAISIPFPLIGVESIVEQTIGEVSIESTLYKGPIDIAPAELIGIVQCIKGTLVYLDIPCKDLMIRINSTIPPGKGLGSSASVAIAIVRSLFAYAKVDYTNEALLTLANIAETYAHGAPSGIDSLTITSNSPIFFQKNAAVEYIKPSENFYFVVADSGQGADTKTAVESVTKLFKAAPKRIQAKLDRIGALTTIARTALEKASKQLLGQVLNEAQKEMEALGLSDAALNHLINFARKEGALGAKLTGSGNGGCIIALAQNEVHLRQLSEKLKRFGAHAVWPFVLKKQD